MEPSGMFAPGVNLLSVLGCGVLTVVVAAGLTYLVGSINKNAGVLSGGIGVFGGLAIMLQLFFQ
ncbi:hypothetical protein ABEG10_37930 (plasmid) [Burkholderia cenocepacia]|uniref:hypothetical protein n=1 Tax=Burkholderia cepacia complex TaxID=87882 RepID=UPI0019089662|nr:MULTISPECIES: hypothetical protein [Burkholderia cepacia complex]MBK1824218.1 hypothetical protein [Burkholderia orbicola]MCO8325603.1 hypothetical protein [Burkholderia cenocepacia]MCO8332673.1 hypothetical protein [Burkholderia cenocepacia]MCO8340173.1 hypothetical protein [Burkholderia cenocepacia]MCO8347459.1 hypothetical protein [Burkholderia cenocepacia]